MSFANTILYVRTIQPIRSKDEKSKADDKGLVVDGDSIESQKKLEELAKYEE